MLSHVVVMVLFGCYFQLCQGLPSPAVLSCSKAWWVKGCAALQTILPYTGFEQMGDTFFGGPRGDARGIGSAWKRITRMLCFMPRKLIPSTYAGVSRDGYAANSQVFMKTWMAILLLSCTRSALHRRPCMIRRTGSEWYKYDFIAKASNGMRRRVSGAKMWSVKQFHRAPDISLGGRSRLRLFPVAVARTCRQVCWSECVLSDA